MNDPHNFNITVTCRSVYVETQSEPHNNHYVFAYTIRICNQGALAAKLLSRHWLITDAHGDVKVVRGLGVVGEQPRLEPGDCYEYTSGTILSTPVGSMQGNYEMVSDAGQTFYVDIPAFRLAVPNMVH